MRIALLALGFFLLAACSSSSGEGSGATSGGSPSASSPSSSTAPSSGGTCTIGPPAKGQDCPDACGHELYVGSNTVGYCTVGCDPSTPCPSGFTCNSKTQKSYCTPTCTTVEDCKGPLQWADCSDDGYCE